jgi:hypothetical protein
VLAADAADNEERSSAAQTSSAEQAGEAVASQLAALAGAAVVQFMLDAAAEGGPALEQYVPVQAALLMATLQGLHERVVTAVRLHTATQSVLEQHYAQLQEQQQECQGQQQEQQQQEPQHQEQQQEAEEQEAQEQLRLAALAAGPVQDVSQQVMPLMRCRSSVTSVILLSGEVIS